MKECFLQIDDRIQADSRGDGSISSRLEIIDPIEGTVAAIPAPAQ
jgi:hypothetical protein